MQTYGLVVSSQMVFKKHGLIFVSRCNKKKHFLSLAYKTFKILKDTHLRIHITQWYPFNECMTIKFKHGILDTISSVNWIYI